MWILPSSDIHLFLAEDLPHVQDLRVFGTDQYMLQPERSQWVEHTINTDCAFTFHPPVLRPQVHVPGAVTQIVSAAAGVVRVTAGTAPGAALFRMDTQIGSPLVAKHLLRVSTHDDVLELMAGQRGALHVGRRGMSHARVVAAAFTVLAATACCAGANRGSSQRDVDLADRYERGDGVPRDFRRAAELLERSCDGGRGVPSACRRLAIARARGRGVPVDRRFGALLTTACERGDWPACGGPVRFDEAKARAACTARSQEACLAVAKHLAWSQSGTAQDERWGYIDAACRAGVLEGCHALAAVGLEPGAEGASIATEKLAAACRRGDVDACKDVGTPIEPRELCAAVDYGACAVVGAAGDDAALERACDDGAVLTACEQIAFRARDADPPDPRALQHLERACRLGSEVACRQSRATDLSTGCAAYDPLRIPSARRRPIPIIRGVDAAGSPWEWKSGTALVVVTKQPATTWDTYAEIADRLRGSVAMAVLIHHMKDMAPAGVLAVRLDAAAGGEPVATTATGAPLDVMDVRTTTKIGDPRIKIMDPQGRTLAILNGTVELNAATFVRCVRSLMAEP